MRITAFWIIFAVLMYFAIRRPLVGLVTYSVLNVVRPETLFWGGSLGARALILAIGVTLFSCFLHKAIDTRPLKKRHLVLLLWIYVAILLSIWFSNWAVPWAYEYANEILKVWVLCYLMILLLRTGKEMNIYLDALLYGTTFLAVWGVDQYFRGNERLEGLGGNAMSDSNHMAAHFVLFFPLALGKALYAIGWKQRTVGILCTTAILAVIICTQSRGGFLGLVVVILLSILRSKKKFQFAVVAVIMALAVAPFVTTDFTGRMGTMQGEDEMDDSGRYRLLLWQAGWMIFLDKPVFGTGFMAFPFEKTEYARYFMHVDPDLRERTFGVGRVVHSTVFQVLSEGGLVLAIPCFLLFFGTLLKNWQVLRRCRRERDESDEAHSLGAVHVGLIGFFVSMLFLNGLNSVFGYVMLTVCAILQSQLNQATEQLPLEASPATAASSVQPRPRIATGRETLERYGR